MCRLFHADLCGRGEHGVSLRWRQISHQVQGHGVQGVRGLCHWGALQWAEVDGVEVAEGKEKGFRCWEQRVVDRVG